MKKGLFITLAALVISASAFAQTTTLQVDIVVEKQDIIAGPYARYAQKYLGVSAPLADKVLYEIKSAKIYDTSELPAENISTNNKPSHSVATSHLNPERGFSRLTVDRISGETHSLEESARLAAARLFEIRKSRFDLITGELGENVFGAGLAAALSELDRLEEEYLALFLGKQTNSTFVRELQTTPSKERLTYIVCRFTEFDGVLPADDLSGEPLLLELEPYDVSTAGLQIAKKPSSAATPHHIPADVLCRLIFNGTQIASTTVPILQLGETVLVLQK